MFRPESFPCHLVNCSTLISHICICHVINRPRTKMADATSVDRKTKDGYSQLNGFHHAIATGGAAVRLQEIRQREEFEFCFIGGLAVQHWGEPRQTGDTDIPLAAFPFERDAPATGKTSEAS